MSNYIAITIGPLVYTMSLFSNVAPLWASSYLFSSVAKGICESLVDSGICAEEDIVVPFYSKDRKDIIERNDGVGLFHDRIIYRDNGQGLDGLKKVIDEVYLKISDKFELDIEFLRNYLNVFACEFDVADGENIIYKCSKMLDCMELSEKFNTPEIKNEIAERFNNAAIKSIVRDNLGISDWQLLDSRNEGRIKDMNSIAFTNSGKGLKRNDYLCFLRSDADNMGQIISGLKDAEQCRSFSESCLRYCSKTANAVREFGGVTIYAGGDDLFALVPCENDKGENVFELISSLNGIFADSFKEYFNSCKETPTLSFGLLICYNKFPLYEAVDMSAGLLFGKSKSEFGGKDCTTVHLLKHSGQSSLSVIKNRSLDSYIKLLKRVEKTGDSEDEPGKRETAFASAGRKIYEFRTLFDAGNESNTDNLFVNTFDSPFHEENKDFYHEALPKFYRENILSNGVFAYIDGKISPAASLDAALRTAKFFTEKEGEK